VVLTVIWLGGTSFLLGVMHTGLSGPIVLLVVVVLVEVAFVAWNEGHLPGAKKAAEEKPRRGSTRRTLIGYGHPERYPLRICSLKMSACPQCWASSRSTCRYTQRSGSGPRQ
jgi:hypothetical protein